MNLHDPNRPEAVLGRKALLGFNCVVPHISIMPRDDGLQVDLTVFLPVGDNEFGAYNTTMGYEDLSPFFLDYYDDPEGTLRAYFRWTTNPPVRKVKVTREPSTEALIAINQLDQF